MANVIKHKRGSGSDPVASDLIVGEVAIRTDVGKLFTKMDNGSVAEIAGGGSDIAINTLSSSSGTGGGSATFNGSAFRFTLSAPPSVSAQQLLVSINGVIQKPVAGTGQPSEGFSVDGTDIILGDAPAAGSDFFILTFKSLGVSEPADNSVTSAKIVDGAIVNADINASAAIAGSKIANSSITGSKLVNDTITAVQLANGAADVNVVLDGAIVNSKVNVNAAIAGSKIDPNFVNQNISTSGVIDLEDSSSIKLGTDDDFVLSYDNTNNQALIAMASGKRLKLKCDQLHINNAADNSNILLADDTGSVNLFFGTSNRISTTSSGGQIHGNLDVSAGLDVIGNITATGNIIMGEQLQISATTPNILFTDTNHNPDYRLKIDNGAFTIEDAADNSDKFVINSDGHVDVLGNLDVGAGIDVTGAITATGDINLLDNGTIFGGDDAANTLILRSTNGNANHSRIDIGVSEGSDNGGLHFYTAGSSVAGRAMTIKGTSQNVGIGTISPAAKFHVSRSTDNNTACVLNNGGTTGGHVLQLKSGGTGAGTHIFNCFRDNNEEVFRLDGSGIITSRRFIGNSNGGDYYELRQSAGGSTTDATLRFFASSTSQRFFLAFSRRGSDVGSISVSASGTSYATSSDYRLKENVVSISDGITRLKTLKPYRFNFKEDPDKTVDGFFAHEVTAVPEAITGTKDEVDSDDKPVYQGIDQSKLVPLLVAALQEAIGRIEALEAK